MAVRRSSLVWDFFTVDISNSNVAVCLLCQQKLIRGHNSKQYSTSPMIQHLKAKHPPEYKLYSSSHAGKAKKRQSGVQTAPNLAEWSTTSSTCSNLSIVQCFDPVEIWDMKSTEAMHVHKAIGRMIIKDLESCRIVEKEGW